MNFQIKKYFNLLLVVIYLTAVNANLVVWIEYNFNYDFIVKFLCVQKDEPENLCHGSCHLKNNLEQNDEQNKPAEKQNRELNNYSVSYHVENLSKEKTDLYYNTRNYQSFIYYNIPSNIIEPDFPPPKLL